MADDSRLVMVPAGADDAARLHALLVVPAVYRFLGDNVAPPPAVADAWIAASLASMPATAAGLWLLEADGALAGAALLAPDPDPASAELTYLLHPAWQGRGLATRMAWTAVTVAFEGPVVTRAYAGADVPNVASIAVMQRLGMRFWRDVEYPAGAGVEYHLMRGDPPPEPVPQLLPRRAAAVSVAPP